MLSRNARIGLRLCAAYTTLYAGFILLNAFAPETMDATPVAGLNVAVLYGFGLIFAAFLFALLYGWLCRPRDHAKAAGAQS